MPNQGNTPISLAVKYWPKSHSDHGHACAVAHTRGYLKFNNPAGNLSRSPKKRSIIEIRTRDYRFSRRFAVIYYSATYIAAKYNSRCANQVRYIRRCCELELETIPTTLTYAHTCTRVQAPKHRVIIRGYGAYGR